MEGWSRGLVARRKSITLYCAQNDLPLGSPLRTVIDSLGDVIFCPECSKQHIDRGEWATRLHHKHLCEYCGHVWRIEPYTFGVWNI